MKNLCNNPNNNYTNSKADKKQQSYSVEIATGLLSRMLSCIKTLVKSSYSSDNQGYELNA